MTGIQFAGANFTPLEQAALRGICEEADSGERASLEAQLSTARVHSRENTGEGFFTRFDVERAGIAPLGGPRLRNGPDAQITGLEHGMGFILWLKDGYADCLEGYDYEGNTSGIDFERVDFKIFPALGKTDRRNP
jgi:hypothetical protein